MVSCLLRNCSVASLRASDLFLFPKPSRSILSSRPPPSPRRRFNVRPINAVGPQEKQQKQQQEVRTLFPGGFKRPEISIPTLVLRLSADDVFAREAEIDVALRKGVGVVVLEGADETGARLYEAACALKSLVRDRAYLLIAERVDVAAAVGASGVVLSDAAIPTVVARNMMMRSKSDSVYLPLVARTVQNRAFALSATSSEGADFLIMNMETDTDTVLQEGSIFQHVKVPIFITNDPLREDIPSRIASKLLKSGASGMVVSLNELRSFDGDTLNMFTTGYMANGAVRDTYQNLKTKIDDVKSVSNGRKGIKGFTKLDEQEIQLIESERLLINEALSIIQKATPTMKDISLLVDAASRLSEPFLLVIVGEFNSGKSTVINALLGRSYLKEGVIPTTNEITLLLYSEMESGSHNRCERNPDGQFICYLSSPILKVMNLVDTPGTNVILQRQQRLTEEFVPRADLILFVISADRPLTESEVAFLSYIQQWRKKVVFILNKLDLYQTSSELEEATSFVKENARKLLNADNIILFPVSARAALDAKLSSSNYSVEEYQEALFNDPRWMRSRFFELENFLFNLLDGTTETGMERVKLKLETPLAIADRLLSSCQTLVKQEYENASEDLISINGIVNSVKDYAVKIESESVSWRKDVTAVIEAAKARAWKLVDSLLQLSNIDLIPSYALKSERSGSILATSAFQNDIISPAISNTQSLLTDYIEWLESSNSREANRYLEQFEKQWPALAGTDSRVVHLGTYAIHNMQEGISSKVIEDFSASAAARLFEQEIREVVLGAFGGLGAAGLSASLLTSVLPTTLEDLLALAFCSAGGWLAISTFPARRKQAMAKIGRVADKLAREINEAMEKDLMISIEKLTNFVEVISKPYEEAAQARIDRSIQIQDELAKVEQSIQALKFEIQNLHVS